MRIASSSLYRLLFRTTAGTLEVDATGITLTGRQGRRTLPFEQVNRIQASQGWIWTTLSIHTTSLSLRPLEICGIGRSAARAFRALVLEHLLGPRVRTAIQHMEQLLGADQYLNYRAWSHWESAHRPVLQQSPSDLDQLQISATLKQGIAFLRRHVESGETIRAERNAEFVQRELEAHREWFSLVESYPLTERQRTAIVSDEDNSLVVAGAGTGKTSTIVGKVGYLLRRGRVRPDQILLLAFARKAKEEMQERLVARLGTRSVQVRTFHSLGLDIIAQVEGTKPSISPLAEDERRLVSAVETYLDALYDDPSARHVLTEFLLWNRYPQRSEHDYRTAHEFYQFLKANDVRTLRGERVKSMGELAVADFLTVHGVRYEYEREYEHPTATQSRRQYKPDFYLPDYGIYIEYFGVDRQGHTAPYIDEGEYRAAMQWKRTLHRTHQTVLIEAFSYQLWEGGLSEHLRDLLSERGVSLHPISADELRRLAKDSGEPARIVRLLCAFLNLFKSNIWTMGEIRERADARPDARRCRAFVDLFEHILNRYETELAERREIDFHDMIAKAGRYVASSAFGSTFKYVLVDEFQDISRGRAALLNAVLGQHDERRLFCVGDDWQSIYRFTGSDVALMTGFADHFGYTQRIDLDRSFRFCSEILNVSQRFILKNPVQLKKQIATTHALGKPGVVVLYERTKDDEGTGLRRALVDIRRCAGNEDASVMVLGRYRFTRPGDLSTLRHQFAGLKIEWRTAHTAKGLEADYVVVLDVTRGRYGFPTEVSDDPVLGLVMAGVDDFPNAEERRLFYVALTRARQRVYLVTDDSRRSVFVEELETGEFAGLVESQSAGKRIACPVCIGGSLVVRRSNFGVFWGCSNYPYCKETASACQQCGKGAFVRSGAFFRCSNESCGEATEVCPQCREGMLRRRNGPYGPFMGCSQWRPDESGCTYTRNLGGAGRRRR